MMELLKKYAFGIIGIIGLFVLLQYAAEFAGFSRTISATGACNTKIPRDKLAITLQIKTLNKNAATSLRAVQNAADDIARRIKAIDDKTLEIQTTNLYSYEKTEWKKERSVLLGIESQIDLEITTESKDTVNAALDVGQTAKNTSVFPQNMRNFSSREIIDKATAECLQQAIMDARNKAETLASGDGETLGRLVSAQFGANNPGAGVRPMMFKSAMAGGMAEDAGYLQSADGDLSIKVEATFKIK